MGYCYGDHLPIQLQLMIRSLAISDSMPTSGAMSFSGDSHELVCPPDGPWEKESLLPVHVVLGCLIHT